MREHGITVNSIAHRHGGDQNIILPQSTQLPITIPLTLAACLLSFKHRLPTEQELLKHTPILLTSSQGPWKPSTYQDHPDVITPQESPTSVVQVSQTTNHLDSGEYTSGEFSSGECPSLSIDTHYVMNTTHRTVDQHQQALTKALPKKLDCNKLLPYFAFRPLDVIQRTLNNTTQMASSVTHYPMQKHFKSCFQMLRKPKLGEVVSTDTVFSNTKSLEGYFCVQFFYGVKSRTIHIVGMQTESDFPNAYKDSICQVGIPAGLHRDNALSEESDAIIQMNRDLIVHDSFTELHHHHQNPVESQAIKHIKNWSKVLLDRRGAPDYCWFLCQEYCAYI